MRKFRTPKRRTTRQRSGFKVAGDKKGSTCKILPTFRIYPTRKRIVITSHLKETLVPSLFKRDFGILGSVSILNHPDPVKLVGILRGSIMGRSFLIIFLL